MFGNIAHNNILRVERVLKMLSSDNQDALEFITSAAEARKDAIEQQYQQNEANLNNQLNQIQTEKANAITEAVGVVGNTAADIADAFDTTAIDEQIRQAKKAEEKNPSIKQ